MRANINEQALTYEQRMTRWGYCFDGERMTIEFLLRTLREHYGQTRVFQRCCFRMSELDFRRLQRMARPRKEHWREDVRHAALVCNIRDVQGFFAAMEQAREITEPE